MAVSVLPLNGRTVWSTVLLFAVLGAIFYGFYASGLIDLFTSKAQLLQFIEQYHGFAALIFIGLQALQVMAAPIPGEITGAVGGVLFGPWGIALSTIGLGMGSWAAFMLARFLGRPLVERFVNPEIIARYDYVMKHKGLFLAFLLFLIPGFPKDYLCYILGLGHMSARNFLMVSIVGRIPGTVLLTLSGNYLLQERWVALSTVIGVSIAIVLVVMIYREKLEKFFRRLEAAQRLKVIVARRKKNRTDD